MASNLNVSIKMFRIGELGDSFLISFDKESENSHILIDFGSFRNSTKSIIHLQNLAREILMHCKDNIDIVVGTHQHNDHVSGFYHCHDLFKNKVKQVWLSWLDNPKIKLAETLGKEHNDLQSLAFKINEEISKANKNSKKLRSDIPENINDIMGFYGAKTPEVPLQGIKILKELGLKEIKYLMPGKTESINEAFKDDVKIYVLGPPMDKAKLYDIKPNSNETYDPHLTYAVNSGNNLYSALLNHNNQGSKDEENYPFNKSFKIGEEDSQSSLNFSDVDFNNTQDIIKLYRNSINKWKTVDNDWLEQASRIALYLDSYTNNSSLVLAIELVKSGKVLLFAGDAQTGNWLSWFDLKFDNEQITTEYLLSNTVLYKVGHHGSHNATLVKGLELMTHEDLVAMIPVDKTDSNITKVNGWKMPAKNLYKQLIKQTKNRVLRMDDTYARNCNPKVEPAKSSWKDSNFKVKSTDLYIELIIKG